MAKKFVRQEAQRFSKLGKNRKKLQKWRKPKGRDSKMRLRMKGHAAHPMIGQRSPKSESGKINGLYPVLVYNVNDLLSLSKSQAAILARIGAKKKLEVIKVAQEKKIKILNLPKEDKSE